MKAAHIRPSNADDYIAGFPPHVRPVLERVRRTIRKAVPAAEEVISYQMPAYRLHGRPVIYFAGWKEHYSLYPWTTGLVAAFKDQLAPYAVGRGTIRFPLAEPVPVKLIDAIARFRAREVAGGARAVAGRRKKRPGGL